jgi:cell division protease FtsH
VLMSGRVAETLLLEQTPTGAANDFEKATEIARKMVCQWGMSELGPLTYGERDDLIFLGRDLAMNKNFSERTAERIDDEVKKIIAKSYARAQELLEKNKKKLLKIAKALLVKEVLDSDEIGKIAGLKMSLRAKAAAGPKDKTPPAAASPVEKKTEDTPETKEIKPLDKPDLVKA